MKKIISSILFTAILCQSISALAVDVTQAVSNTSENASITDGADTVTSISDTGSDTTTEIELSSENPVDINTEQAEETEAPTATPEPAVTATPAINPDLLSDKVNINVTVLKAPYITPTEAEFELYNADNELLGVQTLSITSPEQMLTCTFDVPDYQIGEVFKLKSTKGLMGVQYYETICSEFSFNTYCYRDENGTLHTSNTVDITAIPSFEKTVNISYNGEPLNLAPSARMIDGVTMVPVFQIAEHLGFKVKYDSQYNSVAVSLGNDYMFFNVGNSYTTVFGTDLSAPYPTTDIDGTIYVALRTFADAAGSTLTVTDDFFSLNIDMGYSSRCSSYFDNIPVNKWGIASRTNYMVWVSLSEYRLRLYEGRQKRWRPVMEAVCAIGAPHTPTVTGSFEYQYKSRWDYGSYYVGPCLVFYGGYALHSVLLNQNGTEYDGRVGVKISHGCIRLKKKDIDFIAKTIPVGTRIYITP